MGLHLGDGEPGAARQGAGHGGGARQRRAPGRRARKEPAVPGILLGDELYARTLHVFVGSDVDVACPMCGVGPTGPMPKLKPFRVAGHFYTGMYEFDSKFAYVSLPEAQKFLGMLGEVTGIEVRTDDAERAREVADELARARPRLRRPVVGGAQPGALLGAQAGEDRHVPRAHVHHPGGVVLDLLQPDHGRRREGARDRHPEDHWRQDGAIMRVFILRGLVHRPAGHDIRAGLGLAGTCWALDFGLPLDPDVYYIDSLPVAMDPIAIAMVAVNLLAQGHQLHRDPVPVVPGGAHAPGRRPALRIARARQSTVVPLR